MKAILIRKYGGSEVLQMEEVSRPAPNQGELLVKVCAASVNPVDSWIREGGLSHSLPFVPGWDVSGVVEKIGIGVTRFKDGDEIYARLDIEKDGACAEYTTVKEEDAAFKPQSIDHIHAAAIPIAAQTAWQALFERAHLKMNQKILIHGAAGGVGHFAVQLAKWKQAFVFGTASANNQSFLREIGVDQPIDYRKIQFEDIVRDVDVVLDTIGGETQMRSLKVLKKGGVLVSTVAPPPEELTLANGVRGNYFAAHPSARQLEEIGLLVDQNILKVFVSSVFPLSQSQKAQELSENGHTRGKIVLSLLKT